MDQIKIKKFKKLLMEEKARIMNSNFMSSNEDLEISSDDLPDESDFASSVVNQAVSTSLRDQNVLELKRIEEALERLDAASYFECDECGDNIEEKRLEALPTTKFCISCAETFEHKRKAFA